VKLKFSWLGISFIVLLLIGTVSFYISTRENSTQSVVDKVSSGLQSELAQVDEHVGSIFPLLAKNKIFQLENVNKYSLFVFDHQHVVMWSDNKFVPTPSSVADTFQLKLIKAGNGDYLAKKWVISKDKFLIAIIPLTRKYTITNSYLQSEWNQRVFPSGNFNVLEPSSNIGFPVYVSQVNPFRISFLQSNLVVHKRSSIIAFACISLAIILFVIILFQQVEKFKIPELGAAILYLTLIALRWCMIKVDFPNRLLSIELFNPQIFASSNFNASLGDLVLNEVSVLLVCLYLFRHYYRFRFLRKVYASKMATWCFSIACGVCILLASLFPFVVIQTLYNNSAIVLDISQSLFFNSTRVVAMISILLSGICSFLFAHVFTRLLIGDGRFFRVCISLLISILIFMGINEWTTQNYLSSLLVGVLYFSVVYYLHLYATLKKLSFSTFAYLFTTVFFLSANGAYCIYTFSQIEITKQQFRFANNFLIDRDNFGEYLLHETLHRIGRDAFIQSRIVSPFLNRDAIRQKIRQVFLPGYFNRYDVDISIFDAAGESINNRTEDPLSTILNSYNRETSRTDYDGVFFISGLSDQSNQKYLVTAPIIRTGATAGYVVLQLSLKKVIPQSVYPELLVDNRGQKLYRSQDLSYAVYSGHKMSFSAGFFNYDYGFKTTWLGRSEMYSDGIDEGGYHHIAQEDQSQQVAVVSLPHTSVTYRLANFSFLLVWSLVFVLMFIVILSIVNYRKSNKLNYSARIQLFLNLAFFLPLILVSYTTLRLTNQSSQQQLKDEFIQKTKVLSEQVSAELDHDLKQHQDGAKSLGNQISDLAKLAALDVNVYDTLGVMLTTSQPAIIENNLLSDRINPVAFERIKSGENSFIKEEEVGSLTYFVSYAPLKSPSTGKLWGVLGIPFFQSLASLEKIQINILANILNIFALIFIVLVVLSYFVSKWLTFPLNFITQSLRKTSLTKTNQPLIWRSDDEIGTMVKEYNQMLFKLSESKSELEQTQRELAWREIAQQVAHEIKNPLTPMKLTLQQLERQLQQGSTSSERTEKAVSSLLTQVDTLNDIASSFSSFAKMPEPVMQSLDLAMLLKRIVELHRNSGSIVLAISNDHYNVTGDEQLLGRTFSNIILNAFQSAVPGRAAVVNITLKKQDNLCLLSFSDNGKGIDAEVAERIFLPHFTTKKSGSGLGLAIAKQAIEQMQGRIWFETKVGKGTIFFVEMTLR
jgi:two-component system, NtrC family, nitrogen regulation sensor histidine kinase NtrY